MGFPSRVRHAVDTEPSIVLRGEGLAAITASGVNTSVPLHSLDTAFWHNGEIPFQLAAVVVNVTGIDLSTDETYVLELQVDSDAAFAGADFTVVASINVSKLGVFVVNLDGPTIKDLRDDAKFLRIAATLGGTTPSLAYNAWLAPAVGNAA